MLHRTFIVVISGFLSDSSHNINSCYFLFGMTLHIKIVFMTLKISLSVFDIHVVPTFSFRHPPKGKIIHDCGGRFIHLILYTWYYRHKILQSTSFIYVCELID